MTGSGPFTPPSVTPPGEIATRYGTAWNAHDPDAILSMHAANSALHVVGVAPRVEGDEQIRATLAGMFDLFPDIHFDPTRIHTCPELLVAEFTATTTLARPLTLGERTAEPTSSPITFDGVDVIPLEGGLVREKVTYLDAIAVQRQLGLMDSDDDPVRAGDQRR